MAVVDGPILPDPDWEDIAGLLYDALMLTLGGRPSLYEHEQDAIDAFTFAKFQTGKLRWEGDVL